MNEKMKKLLPLCLVFIFGIINLFGESEIMPISNSKKKRTNPFEKGEIVGAHEKAFNSWSLDKRRNTFASKTPLYWNARRRDSTKRFSKLSERFDHIDFVNETNEQEIWKDTSTDLVWYIHRDGICEAVNAFKNAGSIKRHILFVYMNENWGAFSAFVENRTADWGTFEETLGKCSLDEVMKYLNHKNVLGVITTQFQQINHPKVHSIPLGMTREVSESWDWRLFEKALKKDRKGILEKAARRPQLLGINANGTPIRKVQIDTVIRNFHGIANNTYKIPHSKRDFEPYIDDLLRSKFIMSPAGIGWDCYRNWEALYFGAIPVIEHYNRTDGWFRTFDGLPVVWVSHFKELTPELLESEYRVIVQRRNYTFEKLTVEYWIDFIESLRDNNKRSRRK